MENVESIVKRIADNIRNRCSKEDTSEEEEQPVGYTSSSILPSIEIQDKVQQQMLERRINGRQNKSN